MNGASTNPSELLGKVALVTGSTGGLGRALARAFARAGAAVALHWNRDESAARELASELDGGAERHRTFGANLLEAEAARRLVASVTESMGRLDILVNNAGIFEPQDVLGGSPEHWDETWDRTLRLNLLAPARLVFWTARHLVEAGRGGAIVDVSSRGAFRGEPSAPAYGASKAGLNAFGQSMAQALAPHGIGVFTLAPGFIETPMAESHLEGDSGDGIRSQSPFGRVARPDEVAYWAVCCASRDALFASGTIVDINGASYLRS